MITKNQIEEIVKALEVYSKKDSQLGEATLPLKNNDYIAIIQNGKNVRVSIKQLVDNLVTQKTTSIINLSDIYDKSFTLEEAIAMVDESVRKNGMVITFQDSSTNQWVMYQFRGSSVSDWFNLDMWYNVFEHIDNHFKGFFHNIDMLYAENPYPQIGDYAYVGLTLGESYVYRCHNRYTWSTQNELVKEYVSIIITGSVTVGSNGNWFNGTEDTGIPATPTITISAYSASDLSEALFSGFYKTAVEYGFTGTEKEYLASLKGQNAVLSQEDITDAAVTLSLVKGKFYRLTSTALTAITISTIEDATLESVVEFTTGATVPVLTLPEGLKKMGDFTLVANTTYLMSIQFGLACICSFT